ncbi:hypothetical protein IMCC26134_11510 [Verrucomicrobia bacterium IMCC26134]|jgi:hypothetical protein|nr:hypothetical protein IMCC26134_11510 [Verrucomicrobia bacterium IMCC26134]
MHRFIPDPAAPAQPDYLEADQLLALKKIVRDLLLLPDDTPVVLSEVPCADAGCPLLETTLAVFPDHEPPRRWKFTRPRAALTKLMLAQTLASPPKPSA